MDDAGTGLYTHFQYGEEVSLSDFRGRIVVLNFWASWCPHCRAEMPDFQKLHDQFSEGEDVVLLLINQIDGSRETWNQLAVLRRERFYHDQSLRSLRPTGSGYFGVPGLPQPSLKTLPEHPGEWPTAAGLLNQSPVLLPLLI